jgi:rSAM/selenodomain-associated transferase 1
VAHPSCLLLFTKPATPGRVKTRLIGVLTAAQAARLHDCLLRDLVERLAGGDYELRLAWALGPGEEAPACALPAEPQRGAGLGERLHHGLAGAARSHRRVAAVGSDHPTLSAAIVERAFAALAAGADAVLGPATDGGYYLIALRSEAVAGELFEGVAWSTPAVLEQTLDRCAARGLGVELLPVASDVDTPGDLERLAGELAAGDLETGGDCPRTRALLASWGRLGGEAGA